MFQPLFLLFLCYFLLNGTCHLLRKLPGHRHQIAEEGTPGVWVQLERGQSLGGLAGPFVRRPNHGFVLSQAWKGFFDLLQELSHTCNYLSESPGTKSLPALGQDFLRTDLWCTWCAEHGPALLPSLIPGGFSGLQGGERTEVMWGAVYQNLEFPSCGMMSQTWYYCSLFLCISFPLFWSSIEHIDGAYGQGWITAKWDPHAPKYQGKER